MSVFNLPPVKPVIFCVATEIFFIPPRTKDGIKRTSELCLLILISPNSSTQNKNIIKPHSLVLCNDSVTKLLGLCCGNVKELRSSMCHVCVSTVSMTVSTPCFAGLCHKSKAWGPAHGAKSGLLWYSGLCLSKFIIFKHTM